MYCKLDAGVTFVNYEIMPDFLSRGETNASFQQSGKSPDIRKQLIMCIMTRCRTLRQETTSDVGAGSSGQDVFADFWTSHLMQVVCFKRFTKGGHRHPKTPSSYAPNTLNMVHKNSN